MKVSVNKIIWAMIVIAGVIIGGSISVGAETLYEKYAASTRDSLEQETAEMGRQIRSRFSQDAIFKHQQQIDFAEYFSNLKKALFYGSKLATYSEYERDLQFARDNEMFKGLAEVTENENPGDRSATRKDFVQSKYRYMKKNVQEEIDTYEDFMLQSLEACESLANNDLYGFLDNPTNRDKVRAYLTEPAYKRFGEKSVAFGGRWPEFYRRLDDQIGRWQPKQPSPDEPLIDPAIVEAL